MEKQLPQEYEDRKISLSSLNVGGFAWKRADILSFLQDPRAKEFAVLGGDVLSYKEGKLTYTYDSWSAGERSRSESFDSYCYRARNEALKYLNSYPQDENIVFSPVITSEVTAGWI